VRARPLTHTLWPAENYLVKVADDPAEPAGLVPA
jgi:hypothetical protein